MDILLSAYIAVLGLFTGSFLNVVAIRIPKGESIVFPSSRCPACGHRLAAPDLIPVFSYLFLRGNCRYCGTRVSWLYPAGELATALLFLLVYGHAGFTWELAEGLILVSILVTVTITDLLYQLLPDKIVFFGMIVFLMLRLFIHPLPYWDYLLGFLLGGGIFLLLAVLSKGGMGGGDIKLMAMLGLVLGWKLTLLTILISSFIGALTGGLLLLTGKIKRRQPIPYGPFIAVAAVTSYLWGSDLIRYYLSLF